MQLFLQLASHCFVDFFYFLDIYWLITIYLAAMVVWALSASGNNSK